MKGSLRMSAEIRDDGLTHLRSTVTRLRRQWKLIGNFTAAGLALSLTVAFLLPVQFTGTARILPPQQHQPSVGLLLSQATGVPPLAFGALGLKNPGDLYVGMLKSRSVFDGLIEKFDLRKRYDTSTMVETREALGLRADISLRKDGIIEVSVFDEDAAMAADIANAFVEELTNLTQRIAVTSGSRKRLFFEKQVGISKNELVRAEMDLKSIQESTGLIKLDEQADAIINFVATLKAQISAKEVELQAAKLFATERNPSYLRLAQELNGLKTQLSLLERDKVTGQGNVILPTGSVPAAGLSYIRKLREVKFAEAMLEFATKQYEAARIDEANDSSLIQVVDVAIATDKKSRPQRALIVAITTFLSLCMGILWIILSETLKRSTPG